MPRPTVAGNALVDATSIGFNLGSNGTALLKGARGIAASILYAGGSSYTRPHFMVAYNVGLA